MMNKNVIMLMSNGVGGCEKRFLNLFVYLNSNHTNFYLFINRSLYEHFKAKLSGCERVIVLQNLDHSNVIVRRLTFLKMLYIVIKYCYENKVTSIHYLLGATIFVPFVKLFLRSPLAIITIPDKRYDNYCRSRLSKIKLKFALRFTDKVDFLYQDHDFNSIVPKNCLEHYSPCSFSDIETYQIKPKENIISFASRFYDIKNPMYALKECAKFLQYNKEYKVYLLGTGILLDDLQVTWNKFDNDIKNRIEIKYMDDTSSIINVSKIFLSLQEYENYPSQSLQEAMLAGNLIIATDIGSTRKIVKEEYGNLLIEKKGNELYNALTIAVDYLKEINCIELNRQLILKEQKIEIFVDYYLKLHRN